MRPSPHSPSSLMAAYTRPCPNQTFAAVAVGAGNTHSQASPPRTHLTKCSVTRQVLCSLLGPRLPVWRQNTALPAGWPGGALGSVSSAPASRSTPERELSPCLRMLCADSVTTLTLGGVPLGLAFRVRWLRYRCYVVSLGVTELKLGARTRPQALWLWSPCSTMLRDPTSPVSCVQAGPS